MFLAADEFQPTTVLVEAFLGTGAGGKNTFAAPVDSDCYLEDGRKLVRAANGDQVVSETTLYTDLCEADKYVPHSKVTLPTRTAMVIIAKQRVIGDPEVDHLEVALT